MNITQSRTDWNDLVDQMDDEERIKLRKVLFSILTNRFTVSEMKFSLRIHALIGNKIKAGSDKDAVADELYEHARAEDKVGNLIHSMIHHKTKGRAVQKDLMNNKSFISLPDGDSHQKVNIYLESLPSGGEEGPITVDLPYTDLQLKAVLRALQLGDETTSEFPQYIDSLTELGLMKNNTLKADLDQQVGKDLFDTLFSNRDMYAKLRSVLQSKPVALQLRFSKKAVALSRYPWELLHDGDKFLGMQGGGLQITRYIEFSDPPSPLEVEFPWRVLFISPRPRDKPPLPDTKVPALIRALSNFECEQIEPPTYDALKDKLAKARRDGQPYHIIHFDGHGNVDLMCPKCKKAYGPALEICPECGFDLTWGTNPKGYLYFENSNQMTDSVSADKLLQLLLSDDPDLVPRLMILSACRSGDVRGENIFNGLAPSIIRAGIPAVIAMQGMVSVSMTQEFIQAMYNNLTETGNIPQAVNEARWNILRDDFFMPALYLRSTDATYQTQRAIRINYV